jgi:hypothetical protein
LRSEAPRERVAQHVFPRAAIREPAPSAVAGEEPVRLDGESGGKHAGVKDERCAEVCRKAVLRDARHGAVSDEVGRLKAGLHHVPPEGALRAQEAGHGEERSAQGTREAPPEGEVSEREDEYETDCAPEHAVGPFHEVDRLEVLKRHTRVEPEKKRAEKNKKNQY